MSATSSSALRVADLVGAMEAIAPSAYAAEWDNVGLLVGDPGAPLSRVLLTIDCTREVVEEARVQGCEAIVSYHPPIFASQKRFVAPSPAYEAVRAGIAVYSPHTAFDVATGGTNDVLADALGVNNRSALRLVAAAGAPRIFKLVTFVPAASVEAVSRALFLAGAGHIGNYSSCSFRAPGTGTFLGEQGASPVVGQAGRLEEAAELRLETVVAEEDSAHVVRALRAAHPYEEPAFDLVRLAPPPSAMGVGRFGTVEPATVQALIDRLKGALGSSHVLLVGPSSRTIARVAVAVGSGGELLADAASKGADLFVTGELRHHDALRAQALGLSVVCTLHSTSERVALVALEKMLAARLPRVAVARSEADREPFAFA